ncbi:hypothetical protein AgCh_005978 [Apium graveolens]
MYERLEPEGYNWNSISEETQSFYFEEFKKIQHKREPTADVLFYMTHTRNVKKNIPYGDIEDNGMDDEDGENGEEFEQEKSGEPVDRNALFLKAVGGPDKKNRVYGLGSSQNIFYKPKTMHYPSSFATEEENQQLKHQLTEMNERMKAMENQLAAIIEANSARLPRSPTDLDGQDDGN